jgi:hypothetical protein
MVGSSATLRRTHPSIIYFLPLHITDWGVGRTCSITIEMIVCSCWEPGNKMKIQQNLHLYQNDHLYHHITMMRVSWKKLQSDWFPEFTIQNK